MESADGFKIDMAEWKKGLETTRQNVSLPEERNLPRRNPPTVFIPVQKIRDARIRGETIDLNWGLTWQKNYLRQRESHDADREGAPITQSKLECEEPFLLSKLPPSLDRSYNFLGKQPNDIRCGDVKLLLEEYHQLVRACEVLLVERKSIQAAEHKRIVQLERSELESTARAINYS